VSAADRPIDDRIDDRIDARIDDLARMPPPVPPPPSGALEAELARLTAVSTRRPLRQLTLLVGFSLIYGGGLVAMMTLRRDLAELPMTWFVAAGLAWFVGFVGPVYLATVPAAGGVVPRWRLAGIAAVCGAVGFVVLGLAVHPSGPHSVHIEFSRGYGCLSFGFATAVVPVIAGAVFLRGALPVGSRWVAAALGAGGGSLGGLMLHLHCSVTDALHVGLIHGGLVGLSALVAAILVPRATEVR
jgi:hypothetical protein